MENRWPERQPENTMPLLPVAGNGGTENTKWQSKLKIKIKFIKL